MIIECTEDGDCPSSRPYCVAGTCKGNTEYRKYRGTKIPDIRKFIWFYGENKQSLRLIFSYIGCNVDTWPDLRKDVTCGDCLALVKMDNYRTCRTYCESLELVCHNALEEDGDTCTIRENFHNCDTDFVRFTSDALCQCKKGKGNPEYDTMKIMIMYNIKKK